MNASRVPSGDQAGQEVLALPARRLLGRRRLVDVRDEDVGKAATIRRVGQRPAVGRPRGRDVQLAVDRHAPLVRAVVVGDVDLLRRSAPRRCRPPARRRGRRRTPAWSGPRRAAATASGGSRRQSCARRRAGSPTTPCIPSRTPTSGSPTRNSRTSTRTASPVFCTVPIDQPVHAQLAPAIEGHVAHRPRRRDRRVGVARDHVELALEVQIVPEHFGDRLRDGRRVRVGRERDEVGHGDVGQAAGPALDRQLEVLRLLLRRRLLRRLLLRRERERRAAGHQERDGEEGSSGHQR